MEYTHVNCRDEIAAMDRLGIMIRMNPAILDIKGRKQMARQIFSVISKHLEGKNLKKLKVLDVGCSTGIITNFMADYFNQVIGVDIDEDALNLAKKTFKNKKNLSFLKMDAQNLNFPKNYFDIVICNQVAITLENPKKMFEGILKVLNSEGICFLGSSNKYWQKLLGMDLEYKYISFWELKKLCDGFFIHYYTPKILHQSSEFNYIRLKKYQPIFQLLPVKFWNFLEPIMPNFIWILEKRGVV